MSTTTTNLGLFKYDSEADKNRYFNINNSMNNNWDKIDTFAGAMSTHASATNNPHSVTKSQVGLGNCDNTSDANKPISTATQSALDLKANAADVLAAFALKADKTTLHALKGYSDYGELLTDEQGLSDVTNYAHSTYCGDQPDDASPLDPKKFIKVGSPVITKDGIASGFSSGDYLKSPVIDLRGKKWKIECEFTTGSDVTTGTQIPWSFSHFGYYNALGTYLTNGSLSMACNAGGTTVGNTMAVTANTTYATSIEFTGTKYIFKVNGTEIANPDNSNEVSNLDATTFFSAGININANNVPHTGVIGFKGSVNSKSIKITVDGVPVFSGNKTGIDTIKADDWTLPSGVSAPTITDDGILTSTDSTHYITKSFTNFDWGNWEIRFKNIKSTADETFRTFIDIYGAGNNNIALKRRSTTTQFQPNTYQISVSVSGVGIVSKQFTAQDTLDGYFGYDGTKYYWNINGVEDYVESNARLVVEDYTAYFGKDYGSQDSGYIVNASEDLNCIEFYKNGDLVYQPCLKIPYTESKTGSKIVDSVYRDRVNDMAEQFGYAPYYTLDEDNGNFTLPQVELYGLIGKVDEKAKTNTANIAANTAKIQTVSVEYLLETRFAITTRNTYAYINDAATTGYTFYNNGGFAISSTIQNTSQVVIPVDGMYCISFSCQSGSNSSTGNEGILVEVNGNNVYRVTDDASNASLAGLYYGNLSEGDVLKLYGKGFVTQTEGTGEPKVQNYISIRRLGNKI